MGAGGQSWSPQWLLPSIPMGTALTTRRNKSMRTLKCLWTCRSRGVSLRVGSLSFTQLVLFQSLWGSDHLPKCPSPDTESLIVGAPLYLTLTSDLPAKESKWKETINRISHKKKKWEWGVSSWKWSISLGKFLLDCLLWVRALNRLWAYYWWIPSW